MQVVEYEKKPKNFKRIQIVVGICSEFLVIYRIVKSSGNDFKLNRKKNINQFERVEDFD